MDFIKDNLVLFVVVLPVSAIAIWFGWDILGEVKDIGWEVLVIARGFLWDILGEARDFIADNRGKVIGTSLMALAVTVAVVYLANKVFA